MALITPVPAVDLAESPGALLRAASALDGRQQWRSDQVGAPESRTSRGRTTELPVSTKGLRMGKATIWVKEIKSNRFK